MTINTVNTTGNRMRNTTTSSSYDDGENMGCVSSASVWQETMASMTVYIVPFFIVYMLQSFVHIHY